MVLAAAVLVVPRDLARGVDGEGNGISAARRIEGGVAAAIVEETMFQAAAVLVVPRDLSGGVDGIGVALDAARRIEGRIAAAMA